MTSRRKTGQKPQTRQPLKIDKLPVEIRDEIQKLRAAGRTWIEIEELSARFVKWDSLPTPVLELFPDMRLPHSSLQRWYDLRVDQVRREVMARADRAREWAQSFAGKGFKELPDAVMNALRDQIFMLMESSDDGSRTKAIQGLGSLGLMISRIERTKVAQRKLDIEEEKLEAAKNRLKELGDPRELYLGVVQEILKKLRTRKDVRAVIDPIKEELIQEFSYGAEAYAKQIEAGAA
ncbi:MAG: phage protein Gp27 family protein [Terriglobales bacterium]